MSDEILEGWCTDPYSRHEARWLSDGKPTKLVRDGDTTSYDDPPDTPFIRLPELIEHGAAAGADPVRADDARAGQDPVDVIEAFIVSGRTAPKQRQ